MRENRRAVRLRLGRTIAHLRQYNGFSQERLAEAAGMSAKYLGEIELGKVNPSIDKIAAIAGSLSVAVRDLFPGERAAAGMRTHLLPERDFEILEQAVIVIERMKRARRK